MFNDLNSNTKETVAINIKKRTASSQTKRMNPEPSTTAFNSMQLKISSKERILEEDGYCGMIVAELPTTIHIVLYMLEYNKHNLLREIGSSIHKIPFEAFYLMGTGHPITIIIKGKSI